MSPACVQDNDREHRNCHLFDDSPETGNPASWTKWVRYHDAMENNIRNINDVPRCAL